MTPRRFGPSTLAIHGLPRRRPDWTPIAPPLVQSSTFTNPVGSEDEVLRGGSETIDKYRPIIQLQATLTDVSFDRTDYTGFRAPNSTVKFYLPNEHDKIDVPEQLGWHRLS